MRESSASPHPGSGDALSDPAFLARIEKLQLLSRHLFRGRQRAERRSTKTGASLEFADYREFVPGDDLRHIDWSVYGRHDRLYLKLFEEEEDLHVYILLDCSSSLGMPGTNAAPSKFDHARKLAAALGYLALCRLDRVDIYAFDNNLRNNAGMRRGRQQFHVLLQFLRHLEAGGSATSIVQTTRRFVSRAKHRGLVIVISDFLSPEGSEEGLDILRYSRFEVQAVQVFSREELEPSLTGDLQLVDIETGEKLAVNASKSLLADYKRTIEKRIKEFEQQCKKKGIACATTVTDEDFESTVLLLLRQTRLLG